MDYFWNLPKTNRYDEQTERNTQNKRNYELGSSCESSFFGVFTSLHFKALFVVKAYVTKLATVVHDTMPSKGRNSWIPGNIQICLVIPDMNSSICKAVFAYSSPISLVPTFPSREGFTSSDFTISIISEGSTIKRRKRTYCGIHVSTRSQRSQAPSERPSR